VLPLKHPPGVPASKQRSGRLARFYQQTEAGGLRFSISELLFRAARASSVGPRNAADPSHEVARQKLEAKVAKLEDKLRHAKAKDERRRAKLGKWKALNASKQRKLQTARGKVALLSQRLENLKEGALFSYDLGSLAQSSCPTCASSKLHLLPYPYSTSPSFSRLVVLLCTSCGFGWVPTVPFDLDAYYRTEYGTSNRKDRSFSPEEYFSGAGKLRSESGPLAHYFQRSHDQLALIREFKPSVGTMLDFGSGPGYALFLSNARVKHAIEPDDSSIKYLDYLGASRTALSALPERFYDVILASHSIEHVPEELLMDTLSRLRQALKTDGILCVEVPNASLASVHWPARHEPHTLFFSPTALVRLLEKCGFEVVRRVARVKIERPRLAEPLVTVDEDDDWASTTNEGLCVLARPTGANWAPPRASTAVRARVLVPR
jgi:hypothetical protein